MLDSTSPHSGTLEYRCVPERIAVPILSNKKPPKTPVRARPFQAAASRSTAAAPGKSCDEGGVDSTARGTDYQVRANPGLEQRPQHSDLMRAGIGTAAERERGLAAAPPLSSRRHEPMLPLGSYGSHRTSAERAPHRGQAQDQALVVTENAVDFPPSFNRREVCSDARQEYSVTSAEVATTPRQLPGLGCPLDVTSLQSAYGDSA